jgi:hypothetical protein
VFVKPEARRVGGQGMASGFRAHAASRMQDGSGHAPPMNAANVRIDAQI